MEAQSDYVIAPIMFLENVSDRSVSGVNKVSLGDDAYNCSQKHFCTKLNLCV